MFKLKFKLIFNINCTENAMILVQFLTRESSDAPGQMLIITAARLMDCLSHIQLKGTQAFSSIFIG